MKESEIMVEVKEQIKEEPKYCEDCRFYKFPEINSEFGRCRLKRDPKRKKAIACKLFFEIEVQK